MKNLLILGAGTAGTTMANLLNKKLSKKEWTITVVDKEETHYYQPGFLFLPFDIYTPEQIKKPIAQFIPEGVQLIREKIDRIEQERNNVLLQNGTALPYDILIIATGTNIAPDEIEGMSGEQWYKDIFDFYTFEGAKNLRDKLRTWEGGKLVVHICEMPIKCPVAPLEFAFLADSFFTNKNIRDKVSITYVTPMDGAFTKPKATKALNYLLAQKNINIVSNFNIESVDTDNKKIIGYSGQEVEYDLLVTVPTNMGDPMLGRSGIGDDLNFVPTDHATLQSKIKENIFVIGDATDIPASKAGSVAHFESEILTENIISFIEGKELRAAFDGHSNCFIETGNGKALLIDFNYTHEPVAGTFPIAGLGPLQLLKENRVNHLGKLAFRWVYWNMLIKGRPIPFITSAMNTEGKELDQPISTNHLQTKS
jgi:sulfide:quinone oxidoreductase